MVGSPSVSRCWRWGELDMVFVLPIINYQEGLCGRSNRHSRDVQYDARVTIRV